MLFVDKHSYLPVILFHKKTLPVSATASLQKLSSFSTQESNTKNNQTIQYSS
jgi:hypothetical protein